MTTARAGNDFIEVELTDGAIANSYVPVGDAPGFFPPDAFGSRSGPAGTPIRLRIPGENDAVETDIAGSAFRTRSPWAAFFEREGLGAGSRLRIVHEADRTYRVVVHTRTGDDSPQLTPGLPITRAAVLDVMREYDELGSSGFYERYRYRDARDYVVVHDGKEYPSKGLYGVAYDKLHPDEAPIRETGLSGGLQRVVPRLQALGFEVVSKRGTGSAIQSGINAVLEGYVAARHSEPYGSGSGMWQTFQSVATAFERCSPIAARNTVTVVGSVGVGNWARVPWIAFLDSRETTTTQRGVYPVLLFREDMTGAYMTLAQGVTEPKKLGAKEALAFLEHVASGVRTAAPELVEQGFALDNTTIDLRSAAGLGRDYEKSAIAHKFYEVGNVPADDSIEDDLEALLVAYGRYIDRQAGEQPTLMELAERFREERPYPTDADELQWAVRREFADAFSRENLRAVQASPAERFPSLHLGRFAAQPYGGPGPQSNVHKGINEGGDEAKRRLAKALEHVLYGEDPDEAGRIDQLLSDDAWRVFGLGEALIVKALAVVYPDRWLPVFVYEGSMGKKTLIPLVDAEPVNESIATTPGQRAVLSNQRLREVLEPLFPDDPWAQGQFLYWLRDVLGDSSVDADEVAASADEGPLLTVELVRSAAEADGLQLPDELYAQVTAALNSGKHVIFTGPPGTAKTSLAHAIARAAAAAGRSDGFVPTTATADWTTYETIGGLRPEGSMGLAFAEGHFLSAIRRNRWLLIDELNRSNFDRAFGQLFTVLSGQVVVLPYQRPGEDAPLALIPPDAAAPSEAVDALRIPRNWRVIATMNVFDKSLLFEMSYALMRRFAFIEVGSPSDQVFSELIDEWAAGDPVAASLTKRLLVVRSSKDIGPAVFRDIARFIRDRRASSTVEDGQAFYEAFYSYLLPQFEGIDDDRAEKLFHEIAALVATARTARLRNTFRDVLGVEFSGQLRSVRSGSEEASGEDPSEAGEA